MRSRLISIYELANDSFFILIDPGFLICIFFKKSVKQVHFYDDDVRFWQLWRNRSAAAEVPSAVNNVTSTFASPVASTKGRHFLVICCENKAIFLDLVTMRGRDVPKQELDNKSLLRQVLLTSLSLFLPISMFTKFYC